MTLWFVFAQPPRGLSPICNKSNSLQIGITLSLLGMTSVAFAEPEVLTPKHGGTPNQVFTKKGRPKLKVVSCNMGAARVSNIETMSKAVKALAQDNELIALNEVDIKTKGQVKLINWLF